MLTIPTALLACSLNATITVDPVTDLHLVPTPAIRGQALSVDARWQRIGEGSLEHLSDGSILFVFDARERHGDMDRSCLLAVRSRDEGATWSEARDLLVDPKASLLQPSLRRLGNGDLGMTYSRLFGATKASKLFRRSSDDGATWSEAVEVSHGESSYVTGPHDRLYRLSTGRLIALTHAKLEPIPEKHGSARLATYVIASDDDGHTWHTLNPEGLHADGDRRGERGLWECALVEMKSGELQLVGRTATGWLWQSRSTDHGDTWITPEPSAIPNPLAPAWLTRQPNSDTLLMIHNVRVDLDSGWHGGLRDCLALRRSTDNGHTWSTPTPVEFSSVPNHWFDYPHGLWLSPTRLLIAYRCPVSQGKNFLHRVGMRTQVIDIE